MNELLRLSAASAPRIASSALDQRLVAITCVSLVVLEGCQLEVSAYEDSKSRIQIGELFFRKSRVTCNGVTCNELH